MKGFRTCHACGTRTDTYCPVCVANFAKRRDATTMTPTERADELVLWKGPLEIPFTDLHQRIEELVGRPVWTHELAYFDSIIDEVRSSKTVTFNDVMNKVPEHLKDHTIIVEVDR